MYLNTGLGAVAAPIPRARAWRQQNGAVRIRVPIALPVPRGFGGFRGLGRRGLGAGTPAQVANTPTGPEILDANGNTVYTADQVAANPSLLSSVTSSGCPSGLIPTWTMAGSVCSVPGGNPTCDDPTGVCGSFLLPGQTLAQANAGWVMDLTGNWVWNGPGQPTTPSPGQIGELTNNLVPTYTSTQIQSANAETQTYGAQQPAPAGGGGGGGGISATLSNLSRPGQSPQVGDSWQLVITGAPNVTVIGQATQNGTMLGTGTNYGNTDSTGRLVLSGTFDGTTVGSWQEVWQVGNGYAPTLSFNVAAAPAAAAASSSAPSPSTPAAASSTPAPAAASSSAPIDLSGMLSASVNLFGYSVPVWGLGLAAIAGVVLFSSSGKGR